MQLSPQKLSSTLDAWFSDAAVDEVMIDGVRHTWVVRGADKVCLPPAFCCAQELYQWLHAIAKLNGVRLDPVVGAAGGSLGNGEFRWHCLLPPMAVDGPLVSLRRHRFRELRLTDFKLTDDDRKVLSHALRSRSHILVAGPTGSGKTSFLAALLKELPLAERVFIIESVPELGPVTAGAVRLTPRAANLEGIGAFSLERLLLEALRLTPDRLVVGEVRGNETAVLVEGMRCGHGGLIATLHASSQDDVDFRISRNVEVPAGEWRQGLDAGLLLVTMERGSPPAVKKVSWMQPCLRPD